MLLGKSMLKARIKLVWLLGKRKTVCPPFLSFSLSFSRRERAAHRSLSLARWPHSQGYHLNNTDGLMAARPSAVTGRLLSVRPMPAGDVGGALSSIGGVQRGIA